MTLKAFHNVSTLKPHLLTSTDLLCLRPTLTSQLAGICPWTVTTIRPIFLPNVSVYAVSSIFTCLKTALTKQKGSLSSSPLTRTLSLTIYRG